MVESALEAAVPGNRPEPPRALLVEDRDLLRAGLRRLLEEQGLAVVGEAGDGQAALALVHELEPDVVVLSPAIAARMLELLHALSSPAPAAAPRAKLSGREVEVLRLLANGNDNAKIARDLHISPKTAKNHISSILTKLGVENRIQAAVYAVKNGVV